MIKAQRMFRRIWEIAREVLGDKAYERYAERLSARGEQPATPEEFYVSQLERKYTRPSRCC